MVELIARLKQRGYRVVSLKHCHDGFDLDVEGKDSWKHKRAGAETSLMVGRKQVGIIMDQPEPLSLAELSKRYAHDADIVLAEGFSWEPVPKILVASRAAWAEEKCADDAQLIALVNYQGTSAKLPNFEFSDRSMDGLTQHLIRKYLKPSVISAHS